MSSAGNFVIQYVTQIKHVTSYRQIDKPVLHFTGREEIIETLHGLLTECDGKTSYSERIIVLRGFGGIGKSELVRRYVETHMNDPITKTVAWIDAETKDSTKRSFRNLIHGLNLEPKDKEAEHLSQEFYRHFSIHMKTGLIVFDNVEQLHGQNSYHGIFDYLPKQHLDHVPLILITSRINDWEIPASKYIIEISGLSEEDTVNYLYKSLKTQQNPRLTEAFRRLAKIFDGYPLGLALAASTITSSGSQDIIKGVNNYISRLYTSPQDWIRDKLSLGAATNYKLSLIEVWRATIKKIKSIENNNSRFAFELLNIMAYFPEDYIESNQIRSLFEGALERTVWDFQKGVHILKTYSLASDFTVHGTTCIRIHTLVKRYTRTKLEFKKFDYSYLGMVASFRSDNKPSENAKKIKNSLAQWPWSRNALQEFVIIFSEVLDLEIAWELKLCLEKVITLLNCEREPCMVLYYLSLYYLRKGGNNMNMNEILIFDGKEENAFLLAAKTVFNIGDASVKLENEDSSLRLAISILWEKMFFKDNLISRLKDNLKWKFGGILCCFSIYSVTSRYDSDSLARIFKFLQCYYQDDTITDAKKYFAAAIRSYSNLPSLHSSKFPFRSLWKFFDVEEPSWRHEYHAFVETFFIEGGTQIIVNHIEKVRFSFLCSSSDSLLEFVVRMTRYPGCSETLVMTVNFMEHLKRFTAEFFKISYIPQEYYRYVLLLLWLGLFSSNRILQDPYGKEWAVASVAEEMRQFVDEYTNNDESLTFLKSLEFPMPTILKSIRHSFQNGFKPLESILSTYITSFSGVYDDLAVATANVMHRAYLAITSSPEN